MQVFLPPGSSVTCAPAPCHQPAKQPCLQLTLSVFKQNLRKLLCLLLLVFLAAVAPFSNVQAQLLAGANDPDFNPADVHFEVDGFNGHVAAIAQQDNGKLLVGGQFSSYNRTKCGKIARFNTDGTLDKTFQTDDGFDDAVLSVAVQPDGKVVVGGRFRSYNGAESYCIARLNPDGSFDKSFNTGSGFRGTVLSIALLNDGKIYAAGYFPAYDGASRYFIARLHADGTLDTSFNSGNFISNVYYKCLALQNDGKLLIGGNFTSYTGKSRNSIMRLNPDGSLDTSFDPGTGFDKEVTAVVLQDDGKIVAGGNFTQYNGTARNAIARLHANGMVDDAFDPGSGFDGQVNALALQNDGNLLVGGGFTSYNGTARSRIARLQADGTLDAFFAPGAGFNEPVLAMFLKSDGEVVVGGQFTSYNGKARTALACLSSNGALQQAFSPGTGFNDYASCMLLQPDGKVVAGGAFTSYNGLARNGIARLHPDGAVDTSFDPGRGFGSNYNKVVLCIALQRDGKLLAGGDFISFNGEPHNRIVRLNSDGTPDHTFSSGVGFYNPVWAIVEQKDGKIVVGGGFGNYNNIPRVGILRLHPDGTLDDTFLSGTGFNSTVTAIVEQKDGKLVVGGSFTAYNGTPCNGIIRLHADGSPDQTFKPGTGFSQNTYRSVAAVALQADDKILVGGSFGSYNGTPRKNLARLNPDGSLDTSFDPGAGFTSTISPPEPVEALAIQNDGKILVGGHFKAYNNISCNSIVRLNPDGSPDQTFLMGAGFQNALSPFHSVMSVVLQPDGTILVSGSFTSYNQVPRSRIARLHAAATSANVEEEQQVVPEVLVYPNPARGDIQVVFSEAEAADVVQLVLSNAMGRQVYSRRLTAAEAKEGVKLTTSGLAGGMYFLRISTLAGEVTRRVMLAE